LGFIENLLYKNQLENPVLRQEPAANRILSRTSPTLTFRLSQRDDVKSSGVFQWCEFFMIISIRYGLDLSSFKLRGYSVITSDSLPSRDCRRFQAFATYGESIYPETLTGQINATIEPLLSYRCKRLCGNRLALENKDFVE
jgi:hypothetical protein